MKELSQIFLLAAALFTVCFLTVRTAIASQDDAGEGVSSTEEFQLYRYLTYHDIRSQLATLEEKYPQVLLVENAQDKLGIPSTVDCDTNGSKCVVDIVTVTDFNSPAEDKVQVYISGALHGNERIGPHVCFYLIEYLASNFGKDAYLTYLLRTREIIITPMTNAYGFAFNKREEMTVLASNGSQKSFDPNRDFPYNNQPQNCMNTVAGRTIYKLMVQNLFVTAITFHGGINVIGYPWGSNNHIYSRSGYNYVANEAPDHTALHTLGSAMLEAAGGRIHSETAGQWISKYILGDMTSTVYPVGGGMEDWGYGAGFDNTASDAGFHKCSPQTQPALEDSFFEAQDNVRCAVYFIETDNLKNPSELTYGARTILMEESGDDYQIARASIEDRDSKDRFDGHINRNIRLATTMIDMSKPYIYVRSITKASETSQAVTVEFTVNGCATINEVSVTVNSAKTVIASGGFCNHLSAESDGEQTLFHATIENPISSTVTLNAVVDQEMAKSVNESIVAPQSFIDSPQSHFTKLRIDEAYTVEQNGKFVRGARELSTDVTKFIRLEGPVVTERDIMDKWFWDADEAASIALQQRAKEVAEQLAKAEAKAAAEAEAEAGREEEQDRKQIVESRANIDTEEESTTTNAKDESEDIVTWSSTIPPTQEIEETPESGKVTTTLEVKESQGASNDEDTLYNARTDIAQIMIVASILVSLCFIALMCRICLQRKARIARKQQALRRQLSQEQLEMAQPESNGQGAVSPDAHRYSSGEISSGERGGPGEGVDPNFVVRAKSEEEEDSSYDDEEGGR